MFVKILTNNRGILYIMKLLCRCSTNVFNVIDYLTENHRLRFRRCNFAQIYSLKIGTYCCCDINNARKKNTKIMWLKSMYLPT